MLVADAVQSALATALTAWVANGLPRDPSAWLYRVACNQLVGVLRKDAGRLRILASTHDLEHAGDTPPSAYFADEVRDDLLRMSRRATKQAGDFSVRSARRSPEPFTQWR